MPSWTKEQEQAIYECGKNIIVSAGAGSGKTAVLTARTIEKLKNGIDVDHLLVLTFTKEAAYEMKERIRKAIKKDDALVEQLNLLDSAYITTFDSYSLSLVKKYHYLLNVSNNVSIIDSSVVNLKKNKIIDAIFDDLYKNNDEDFLKLIGDLCVKDDSDIKKYILSISNKLDLKLDKEEYLDNYLKCFFNDIYIDSKIKEYENIIISKVSEISKTVDMISSYCDGKYYGKLMDALSGLLNSRNYEDIKTNISVNIPRLPNGSDESLKKYKEILSSQLKDLSTFVKYDNTSNIKENILITKPYIITIIKVIKLLDKEIMEYKMSNDVYEFGDISKMAIRVLRDNPEICQELKEYYNEILVDEYQDTNDLQETFVSLIANNNVYMVGDIKQSIYRFRNANPDIFRNKYNNYQNNNGGLKIDLLKNFRSRYEVLDNINVIFDLVMDDNIGGAEYRESHRMNFGNTTYIEEGKTEQDYNLEIYNYPFEKGEYSKEELEIFIIANDIKEKIKNRYQVFDKDDKFLRDITYSDFCIIMDRNTEFDKYKQIFEYLQIPLTLYQDEKMTNENDILIIKNIMNLIIKIHDKCFDTEFRYNFISIARSFLYRLPDDEIFTYFMNRSFFESDIYVKAKEISDKLSYISNTAFVKEIVNRFDFYKKCITVGDIERSMIRINYLIDMASNLSNLSYTPREFVNYINDMIDSDNDIKFSLNTKSGNSVKIMNIHKSKGLEFHICYYSGMHKPFNTSDLKERFTYDNDYGIIVPYFKNGIGQTIYKDLLKNKYMKEEISEKIRLFYVAMTRCKEKMIIVTSLPESENQNKISMIVDDFDRLKYKSFLDILVSIRPNIEHFIKNISFDDIFLTKDYNITKTKNFKEFINDSNEEIIEREVFISNDVMVDKHYSKHNLELVSKDTSDKMEFGTNMHYVLEIIDFKKPDLDSLKINDFQKKKINNFLNSDLLFNVKNASIYKEYEFMFEKDNSLYHGIIDLMLEYDNYIDIIDYKLKDISDENYILQLNGYRDYIKAKTGKDVNIYLYSIIDEKYKKIED